MTLIAIMQPTYFPWIGYYDIIDQVDKFVFFDDANVLKRSWGVRNRIKGSSGEMYLTVPIKSKDPRDKRKFNNTPIDYSINWQKKHLKSIYHVYSKSKYFNEVYKDIQDLLNEKFDSIGNMNISIIRKLSERLCINEKFCLSSILDNVEGNKDFRLVNICRSLNASAYLSPKGSATYIELHNPGGAFNRTEIQLYYHNFEHPKYPQLGSSFLSHMSIIDLLMNCGYKNSLSIIRSGRKEMIPFDKFRKLYLNSQG